MINYDVEHIYYEGNVSITQKVDWLWCECEMSLTTLCGEGLVPS